MSDTSPGTASGVRDSLITTETREVSPSVRSVGLRTHPLRFDNLSSANVLPRTAEEFLIASRNVRHDRETQLSVAHYFSDPVTIALAQASKKPGDGSERIALPEAQPPAADLADAIATRRSARQFARGPLSLEQVATLLRYGNSETAEVLAPLDGGGEAVLRLRTAPSAGGLYPVELWVAALDVTGLARGVYRYLPHEDALELWAGADTLQPLLDSCVDLGPGGLTASASAVLLFVGSPWRSMRKYGPRGMRFLLHETGAISQNVHLTATALEVGSLDYSGYFDDETHRALGVDGVFRAVVHLVLLGAVAQ
ncbi:SagB-type dehydrogenase family enzyme [Streptomyces sp. 1114.5]|nr:SagB-type dehydrogenase family enzyme [Streptomyces sp. 1114.5]